jgi:hypothetical protein
MDGTFSNELWHILLEYLDENGNHRRKEKQAVGAVASTTVS